MKVGDLFAQMQIDFSQFNKDEKLAQQRTETLGASLSGVLKNAFSFGIGMGFFQAVQRGFRATIGSAVSFNDTLEQATIGFTTMLGSARRADAFLSRLADFAAHTPFEFEGLLDASKRMMALGFAADDVIPTMTAIGDAAAALGSGQQGIDSLITGLGNIKTQGKVTGIAMMQLARAGVPAWDILAESIGKTTGETRKMVEQGLISADQGIAALVAGMEKRFPGMMSKMEDSWRGVTATIRDVWSMTLGEMTKGLFSNATEWLRGIRDTMQGFYDALKAGGLQYAIQQTFGAGVAASVGTLVSALKGLWNMVVGVAGAVVRNWTLIRNLTLGVVWAFTSFKIAAFAVGAVTKATSLLALVTGLLRGEAIKTSLTTGFLARAIQIYNLQLHLASMAGIAHVGVLQVLKTAIYSVTAALGTLLWPLIIIGALLGGGIAIWSKYNQAVQASAQKIQAAKMAEQQKAYTDAVTEAAKGTDAQTEALEDMAKVASKNLQSFDEVHTLMDDMGDVPGLDIPELDIPTPDDMAIPGFELPDDMFADFEAQLPPFGERVKGFFSWLWQEIAVPAWDFILGIPILGPALGWIAENVKKLGPVFSSVWDWISTTAVTVWTWLSGFLSTLWQGIVSVAQTVWGVVGPFFGALWEGVKTVFSAVWGVIQQVATTVWTFLVGTAQAIWGVLGPFFETLWGVVKEVFSVAWNAIQYAAVFVWTFLVETAKAIWDVLGPFFTALWEGIKAVFEWVWNTLGPWLVSAWNWLVEKGQAIWDFLKPYFEALWKAVTTIFEIIIKPLIDWVVKIWDWVKEHTLAVWNAIKEHIVDPVAAAKKDVEDLITKIKEFVSEKWTAIKEFALDVWQRIKEHIVDPILAAKDKVEEYMGNLKKSVEDIWGKVKDAVKEIKDKIYEYLIEPFQKAYDFIKDTWGKITGFFKGSGDEGKSATAGAAEKMMEGAEDYLAFHSPTRKGPGRYADKWAPNLMKMYAEGILASASLVQSAAGTAAQSLGTMASMPRLALGASSGPKIPMLAKGGLVMDPTLAMLGEAGPEAVIPLGRSGFADEIAQAVYQAIMDAFRITQASSGQSGNDDKELVLKIDNTVLARMQLPAIIREGQRQGLDLVVRPQGV